MLEAKKNYQNQFLNLVLKSFKMKKQIKFSQNQAQLISKSIDAFKNDTVKNVAKTYFGAGGEIEPVDPPSHSKGTYSQSYSRYGG